ncbi:hypothetical protein CFC21_094839 [Triticum aestivum]|uniref:Uncharacterized protein n=2 Tax=Triticum aestivum TaxID=4565 RepID=A0A3B6QPU0_WHEAT|nr:hypothetical protein CFC21_094839 [Triticum aestivum]
MAGEDEEWSEDEELDEEDRKATAAWDEMVDRIRARQRARLGGGKPMKRLQHEDVIYILSLEKDGNDYVTGRGHRYPAEEMKSIVDMDINGDDEIDERQARVMRQLSEKGYVQADDYYLGDDDEYLAEAKKLSDIRWERLMAPVLSRRLARMGVTAENDDNEEDYYLDEEDYSEVGEEEGENPDDKQIPAE